VTAGRPNDPAPESSDRAARPGPVPGRIRLDEAPAPVKDRRRRIRGRLDPRLVKLDEIVEAPAVALLSTLNERADLFFGFQLSPPTGSAQDAGHIRRRNRNTRTYALTLDWLQSPDTKIIIGLPPGGTSTISTNRGRRSGGHTSTSPLAEGPGGAGGGVPVNFP